MKHTKLIALILAMVTMLTSFSLLTACNGGKDTDGDESSTASASLTESNADDGSESETQPTADKNLDVNIMVLNGTTGFGMAQLMDKNAKGDASLKYSFSVESDASNITAALLNGSADIAALPTNAAANLFNKKADSLRVLAVNTLGVLYVMTAEGVEVTSMADLEGKTVYCPAQNPTFIFKAICDKNNINVTIDNTYAQPADLRAMLVSGQVDIAVLPEPMVTIAKTAAAKEGKTLNVALDLTAEWDKVFTPGSLAQGCVVVRKAFADEHPAEVAAFLAEYEASINYVKENPTEAGTMIQEQNIFAQGPVAAMAIPNCNICYMDGADMKDKLSAFYAILFEVAPASIGGAIPGDGLYYVAE